MTLSDSLVLDARMAGKAMERSIAGQIEFWARIGRAVDPLLNGNQAMALSQRGYARPLSELLREVEMPAGRRRLAKHLAESPFPHYQAHPTKAGLLIKTDEDGKSTVGRFVNRVFVASRA